MRVTLRLPEELHQRLQTKAQQAGVSLNQTIVATLSDSLGHGDDADDEHGLLQEQVQHVRTALGDLTVELDPEGFPAHLRPAAGLPDREAFMRSLPRLDPPLSATIIADRDDRF